jgi:hypothetical protein
MGLFLQALEELLPGHLYDILDWDFIPFNHVADRHGDLPGPPLIALFEAYLCLHKNLNLETLASQSVPEESWGCMRCGYCCTSMRPGSVKASTYRSWEEAGAPVAWFYSPSQWRNKNPVYKCWYHNGIRLRICPFMLINLWDLKPFCSIYHMGNDFRPSECSGYLPRHETCMAEGPTIEAWESQ